MKQGFTSIENTTDENGNPTGGHVRGLGIDINWQNGPLGRGDGRIAPNGAFVEDVLVAAQKRIEFYQRANGGKFRCRENAIAITKIEEALMWLESRPARRESAGIEGTHVEEPKT